MSFLTLALISVGVAADAFAVSIAKGLQLARPRGRDALAVALTFGAFQAVMPLIGWLLGSSLSAYITAIDHWIAFALLSAIGLRMIWEGVHTDDAADGGQTQLRSRELLTLGLATSVDALAVGIGFAFLDVDILGAVALIGATTFGLSLVGVWIGRFAGSRLRGSAEIVGGLLLIGIGTRILLDHLGAI